MLLSLGTRSGRFSTTPMGFHPGSLVLSTSIIREDKEPAFCPRAAIEEQRASPKAKQKTLMCFIAPPMHVGISKRLYIAAQLLVSRNRTSGFQGSHLSGFGVNQDLVSNGRRLRGR